MAAASRLNAFVDPYRSRAETFRGVLSLRAIPFRKCLIIRFLSFSLSFVTFLVTRHVHARRRITRIFVRSNIFSYSYVFSPVIFTDHNRLKRMANIFFFRGYCILKRKLKKKIYIK